MTTILYPSGPITYALVSWHVTDACAYRRLMATGPALAKAAIARAEQMAGRSVDKMAVAHGHHTHDGVHWHTHKG